jgi:2-polyprenyl-6-methoxyphenol hydroxylase-like FAD-dependent oxidoreductase
MLEGVNTQWGKKCIGYDEFDDEVWAIFQDGTRVRGDILIGCDGINSPGFYLLCLLKKKKKNI